MMTFEEFSKLKSKLHLEIDEYKKEMLEKSKSEMEAKMKSVTGGVNIPGLTL